MQPVKIAEGREAEILSWDEGRVLRLYRDPAAGAQADREMLALSAVRSVLRLVPAAFERIEWQGRPGIVMERVTGRDALTQIARQPWRMPQLAALSGRVHAELNRVAAPGTLPALRAELGRRIRSHPAIPGNLRDGALEALAGLPDGTALCHGDFQIANLLLGPDGPLSEDDQVLFDAIEPILAGEGVPVSMGGTGHPLPADVVLDAAEQAVARAAIQGYNEAIAATAARHGLAMVDIHALVTAIDEHGIDVGGEVLTTDFLTGGLFSLDGVHPTCKGQGVVANALLDAIEARYGVSFPRVSIPGLPGITLTAAGDRAPADVVPGLPRFRRGGRF